MFLISNLNQLEIYFFLYIFSINFTSFIIYGTDKIKAKKKSWRISEATLFLLGFLGGGTGSLMAMSIFKHKSSKKRFYIGIPVIIILNAFCFLFIINFIK